MIQLNCIKCGAGLSIDDAFAGGVCRCQHCGAIQKVPSRKRSRPTAPGDIPTATSSAPPPVPTYEQTGAPSPEYEESAPPSPAADAPDAEPADEHLTRADLKAIRLLLDGEGFGETALHRAWEQAKSEDIAASIIGYIRQAALGDPLRPYADRVRDAVAGILKSQDWTPVQRRWLDRIAKDIATEVVVDRDFLNDGQYKVDAGGFERLNKVFGGRLEALLGEIGDGIWKATG